MKGSIVVVVVVAPLETGKHLNNLYPIQYRLGAALSHKTATLCGPLMRTCITLNVQCTENRCLPLKGSKQKHDAQVSNEQEKMRMRKSEEENEKEKETRMMMKGLSDIRQAQQLISVNRSAGESITVANFGLAVSSIGRGRRRRTAADGTAWTKHWCHCL